MCASPSHITCVWKLRKCLLMVVGLTLPPFFPRGHLETHFWRLNKDQTGEGGRRRGKSSKRVERRRGSKDNQTENKGGLSRELPVKKIKKRSTRKFDQCLFTVYDQYKYQSYDHKCVHMTAARLQCFPHLCHVLHQHLHLAVQSWSKFASVVSPKK